MKVWVIKSKRKKSYVWLVKAYDKLTGKTKDLATFPKNKKTQALAFKDEKTKDEPGNLIPADITFDQAFKEYKHSILSNKQLVEETRLLKCGFLNSHIAPYISKEVKFDGEVRHEKIEKLGAYTYFDFKHSYIPQLLQSKKTQVKNKKGGGFTTERTKDPIGKKTIKDVVGEFKMFVHYCRDRKWYMPKEILEYEFTHNFFQDYITKSEWVPKKSTVNKIIDSEKDLQNKALFLTAAICGPRLNEILALTYCNVDLLSDPPQLKFRHSVDKWNNFREHKLKTASSRRETPISKELVILLKNWMQQQKNPKRVGKYKLLFGSLTKKSARGRVKRAAKALGLKWVGGLKPLRKFRYSLVKEQGELTDIQARQQQGWTMESKTPQRYYHKNLDSNPEKTKSAINKLLN